jgi:(5-formylfuran-3-yl)methyl phosphate synthase
MRLLVSVATAEDARAAVEGGADIVDAKDPEAGALGAVTLARLREIRDVVAGSRPLTAALGDGADPPAIERMARDFAETGVSLVKIGLLGAPHTRDAVKRVRAAMRGAAAHGRGVVVVAYADASAAEAPRPAAVIDIAMCAGARGVLIDTVHKHGPGLLSVTSVDALRRWAAAARAVGLLAAVAGKLTGPDLGRVAASGADVAGVRGAACIGERNGQVSSQLVRELVMRLSTSSTNSVFSRA